MSSTDVLEILDQYGEFSISQSEQGSDTVMLSVAPIKSWGTQMRYGGRNLYLDFRDGVLINVTERYRLGDDIRNLCE
jgi:hypothetical protein